ncbi:head maturation protease, ClpP-related [Ornithobacterium rhinotracheale]|uniref:head maturation protease, ClpP-related n=1 Tax=Ornithobacterium rhinotracheale TaxID=28251 RepID=UPI004036E73F
MLFTSQGNELKCYGRIYNGDGVDFIYYFENLQKNNDEIIIRLHTYGGSVIDGNLMFNAINQSKAKVQIIVEGLAASMGAILLMATPHVKMAENAFVMIHAPSGGVQGTAKDLKNIAKLLEAMENNFISKLIGRTGKTRKEIEALMVGDHWFDASQALTMGLVQEVIPAKSTMAIPIDEPQNIGELEVFNAFASLLVKDMPTAQNETINKQNTDKDMKQLIITAFALAAVTSESSDTAVLEALKGKFKELEKEKDTALNAQNELKQKLETFQNEQINAVIEAHAKTHTLTDEKKEIFQKIGKTSGVDALIAVLDNQTKASAPNINGLINKGQGDGARANWSWDEWQEKDPRGLEALAKENTEAYQKLYNEKYKK